MGTLRSDEAARITVLGLLVNFILSALKFAAGVVGRSGAIMADATHSLSDSMTDIGVLWGIRIAKKPEDECHRYGHGKMETLVTLLLGLVLILVALRLLWTAAASIHAFWQGQRLVKPGWVALAAAGISIVSKEWLYRATVRIGEKMKSQAVVANAWHHRTDAFSSIGVMAGIGGAIVMGENWRILDPLAAIVVSFLIIGTAVPILYKSGNELIEASLGKETEADIVRIVCEVPGARVPHNIRTRRIGPEVAVDIHIKVDQQMNITQAHDIATQVEKKIQGHFGPGTFVTVHVEPLKEKG